MSAFETLIYERDNSVAQISLNRPQVRNAYNIQMRDDFHQALSAFEEDSEARVLLIRGEGSAFCAGADLTEFGSAPSQIIARDVRWERDVWGQLRGLNRPVVTAVHGYCIGSGLEIALLSDFCIAAEGTWFAMPEVQLGMIPAAGGSQTLPRYAGSSRALDVLLAGRRFDTEEAYRLKLITRRVPQPHLLSSALELCWQMAQLEPELFSAAKRALRGAWELDITQGLKLETRLATMTAVNN